jgi:hypothetical protein
MVTSALVATQMTDRTARVKMLTIAGVDVNGQVGFGGNGYHVPVGSIDLDEQGPGGVSTMSFDLVDPLAAGPVPRDGDEVSYWDITNDVPLFGGFVSNWATSPLPSGQGRRTTISCVGFEVILDWAVLIADLVIPATTEVAAMVQSCVAASEGTGPLRAFMAPVGTSSRQAGPIAGNITGIFAYDLLIPAGTSLREALRLVSGAVSSGKFNPVPTSLQATVDFYRGLRAMKDSAGSAWAIDFTTLNVVDTIAGANAADGLEHETDATQIVRGVYVKGANAAGSGYLGDGSGKPGRVAYINDSTIDTAAKLDDAQSAYLNQYVIAQRGSFGLTAWAPTAGVRVGSLLTITDAQANATGTYRIYGLTKRFLKASRETWTVQYGGLRPSASRLIRRLTRPTRS